MKSSKSWKRTLLCFRPPGRTCLTLVFEFLRLNVGLDGGGCIVGGGSVVSLLFFFFFLLTFILEDSNESF